jgi:predicted transcriptional regulator
MASIAANLRNLPRTILSRKEKTRYFDLRMEKEGLVSKSISAKKLEKERDFSDLELLRQLLTKEKINLVQMIKKERFKSIYDLAKKSGRDFKAVWKDLKLLERFGLIEFHSEKKSGRTCFVPVVIVNKLNLVVEI